MKWCTYRSLYPRRQKVVARWGDTFKFWRTMDTFERRNFPKRESGIKRDRVRIK